MVKVSFFFSTSDEEKNKKPKIVRDCDNCGIEDVCLSPAGDMELCADCNLHYVLVIFFIQLLNTNFDSFYFNFSTERFKVCFLLMDSPFFLLKDIQNAAAMRKVFH